MKQKTSLKDVQIARRNFLKVSAAAAAITSGVLPATAWAEDPAWAIRPETDIDTINFVVWQYGNIYEEIAAQFEKDWGVSVEKIIEPNIEPQIAKLTTMYASGEDVDVFVAPMQTIASYIDQGIAQPLNGLPGVDEYVNDFSKITKDIAVRNGDIWGLPYLQITWAFAYNDELLTKAGFEGQPFQTWDELTEQCIKAKRDGVSKYPLLWVAGSALDPLPSTFFAQVCNRGGRIFDENMNPELGPGSIARETLQYFQDSFLKHEIADPDSLNLKFLPAVKVFNTGRHIYLGTIHNYFMNQVNDPAQSAIAGKGKIHPLPSSGNTIAVAWYYMMSDATRDREWAWKMLQYLGGKTKDGNYTQALKLAKSAMLAPGYKSLLTSQEISDAWSDRVDVSTLNSIFEKSTNFAEIVPAIDTPWYTAWVDMLNVELTSCLKGELTVDQACDNIIANVDRAKG